MASARAGLPSHCQSYVADDSSTAQRASRRSVGGILNGNPTIRVRWVDPDHINVYVAADPVDNPKALLILTQMQLQDRLPVGVKSELLRLRWWHRIGFPIVDALNGVRRWFRR